MMALIALRNQRELTELKTQLQQPSSPNYRKWISTAEFMRRFGPTQQQMNEATSWLAANHFTIDEPDIATRSIRFSGTVTQAERAFSMEIASKVGGYANVSDPRIPTRLAGTIAAIFGLSGQPSTTGPPNPAGIENADVPAASGVPHFTPQDFWYYYDEISPITTGNNGGTGANDCIGLLEAVGMLTEELDGFDTQFGLPSVSLTTEVTDPSQPIAITTAHYEIQMDVEWAHAVAPNTPIVLYIVTNSDQSPYNALSLAVSQNRRHDQFQHSQMRQQSRDRTVFRDRISSGGSGPDAVSRFGRLRLVLRLRPASKELYR
jgi:subtilase family serine protease